MESNLFVKVTPEIIEKAIDYIPLMEKQNMAETIGQKCIARVKMTMRGSDGHTKSLPDRFQETQLLTNLYLMGILAKCYLHIPYEGDGDTKEDNPYYGLQMPLNIYDRFAGSHVMNQLEQLKADKACKDKVYNILYDYRKLQRMINAEIEMAVEHQNDVVWRFLDVMETTAKESFLHDVEAENTSDAQTEETAEEKAAKVAKAKEYLASLDEKVAQLTSISQNFRKKLEMMDGDTDEGAAMRA